MSKAILLMDMPKACFECPLCYKAETTIVGYHMFKQHYRCKKQPQNQNVNDLRLTVAEYERPNWCPLKEVPDKSFTSKSDYYQWGDFEDGWNACIDEILGE